MPHSINGTGTVWYGHALPDPDGSVVVTEWLALFFIPITPLGSKRVLFVSDETKWYTGTRHQYTAQRVPLYMPHVLKAYGIIVAIFLVLALLL